MWPNCWQRHLSLVFSAALFYHRPMNRPTFLIQSLGCKVNQYDGGRLADLLVAWGLQPVADGAAPDVFILNSCAVTGRASQKARQALNGARREWPRAKIVLAGCEARLREIQETPTVEADAVIVPAMKQDQLREIFLGLALPLTEDVAPAPAPAPAPEAVFASSRTRAFLKIQDGCRHFCSYCIIPHLRGEEYSKPVAEALGEARRIVEQGHREIVVTGIHLGRYAFGLIPVLRELEAICGLERLRLSSIEPHEITEELIEWLASAPKACRHLHLPLQAGEDETLRRMNRPYTTADFVQIVERIRRRVPDIALTTDFIVGFPGETDEQFAKGLAFVESIGFSRLHIFRFSPRKGTPAAEFPQQHGNAVKKARSHAAEAAWKRMAAAYHERFLGRPLEVLWEKLDDGFWTGFSREYIPCRMSAEGAPSDLANCVIIATVVATSADDVLLA
jgi:threonylcarbamoyladenosine tRNA methylthiotransferase MtaB